MDVTLDELSSEIIRLGIELHMALGPGLLESAYERMLAGRLERAGLRIERQQWISFEFDGEEFENAYRVDIVVEGRIVLEFKSQSKVIPVNERQLLTYLRIMNLPLGLVLNFGGVRLTDGIRRVINPRYSPDGTSLVLRCSATRNPLVPQSSERLAALAAAQQDVSAAPLLCCSARSARPFRAQPCARGRAPPTPRG